MDQSNSQNPNSPPENTDLAKQYQDILDRYSDELAKLPPPTPPSPSPEPPPVSSEAPFVNPEPPAITPKPPYVAPDPEPTPAPIEPEPTYSAPSIDQEIPMTEVPVEQVPDPTPTPEPPPPVYTYNPTEIPTPPPVVPTVNLPMDGNGDHLASSSKRSGGFLKFIFTISLLIFLGVFGAVVYSVFFANKTVDEPAPPEVVTSPTPDPTTMCELNDRRYLVGESFWAADACNTCSCTADLTIICTERTCDATPSSKALPSTKATPTLKVTPSKTSTTSAIPADWKTYTNKTSFYSLKYPANWLLTDLTAGKQVELFYQPDKTKSVGELLIETIDVPADLNTYVIEKNIGTYKAKCKTDSKTKTWCYLTNSSKANYSILIVKDVDPEYNKTLDQILTTFKFL